MCDLFLITVAMAILGGSIIVSNYLVLKGLGVWGRSPDGDCLPAAAYPGTQGDDGQAASLLGKRPASK